MEDETVAAYSKKPNKSWMSTAHNHLNFFLIFIAMTR
jgi:hypothetical protein